MKRRNIFLSLSALFVSLSALASCSGGEYIPYHSVIYEFGVDEDGGLIYIDNDYRKAEFVKDGGLATPPDVYREGYGAPVAWCLDEELTQEFDFSTPIIDKTHLWARWYDPEAKIEKVKFTEETKILFSETLIGDLKTITDDMWQTVPIGSEKWESVSYKIDPSTTTNNARINQEGDTWVFWAGNAAGTVSLVVTLITTDGRSLTDTITFNVKDTVPTPEDPGRVEPVVTVDDVKIYDTVEPEATEPIKVNMGDQAEVTRSVDVEFTGSVPEKEPTNTNVEYVITEGEDVATIVQDPETGECKIVFHNDGTGETQRTVKVTAIAENSTDGTIKTSTIEYNVTRTTHIQKIELSPTTIELFYSDSGYSETYSKTSINVTKMEPTSPTNPKLSWKSSDDSIASVDGEENLSRTIIAGEAPAKGGTSTATITVKPEDVESTAQATCLVTVLLPANKISFAKTPTEDETTLEIGDTFVSPDIVYSNTKVSSDAAVSKECKSVTWSSSDASVATVDENGKVTAIKGGTADIIAHYSYKDLPGVEDIKYNVKVISHITAFKLNATNLLMVYNNSNIDGGLKTFKLEVKDVEPEGVTPNIKFSSDKPNIATVDETTGVITVQDATKNQHDKAIVTITAQNIDASGVTATAKCEVCVVLPVEKIEFTKQVPDYLLAGVTGKNTFKQELKLTTQCGIEPSTECKKALSWTSETASVATVANDGTVTAQNGGDATIKVATSFSYAGTTLPVIDNSYSIHIAHKISSISVSTTYVFLANKIDGYKTTDVEVYLSPSMSQEDVKKEITIDWEISDDIAIITPDSADKRKATITATDKYGDATIYVTATDLYDTSHTELITVTNYDTDPTPGKLKFSLSGNEWTVSANPSKFGNINIPDTYDAGSGSYPVTAIASDGFKGRFLTNVLITHSIKTIGDNAFYGCDNLSMVLFNPSADDGNQLESIGSYAFYKPDDKHTKLNYIGLECCKHLKFIGNNAFENQLNLLEITIPSNVIQIGTAAFNNCASLKTIYVESATIAKEDNPGNLFSVLSSGKKVVKVPAGTTVSNVLLGNTSYYAKTTEGSYDVYTQK